MVDVLIWLWFRLTWIIVLLFCILHSSRLVICYGVYCLVYYVWCLVVCLLVVICWLLVLFKTCCLGWFIVGWRRLVCLMVFCWLVICWYVFNVVDNVLFMMLVLSADWWVNSVVIFLWFCYAFCVIAFIVVICRVVCDWIVCLLVDIGCCLVYLLFEMFFVCLVS